MTLIVTWLWQGLAIAWITAAAVRTMPRLNAATRHAVWWLALAAVLAIPVAHGLAAFATGRPSASDLMPLDIDAVDAAGALMLPAFPDAVVAGAAVLWALTTALGVLRIAKSCRTLVRLKRTSSPFDRSREARLPLWVAACDGGHRTAELRTSDCMTGACALGLGRPVILVSRSVAGALSDDSLDEIVMHEQAHLDRYDDWSQLLVAVVGSLAGLHPAVRFLARRLDVDREAACDDRVVSRTGATRRYASSLLAVAAASNPEAGGAGFADGVPGATTTASVLRVRVNRLLDPRRDRGARLAGTTSLVSVAALALAVVVSTQVAPVVIFVETAAGNASDAAAAPAGRKGDGSLFTKNEKRDPSPLSIERPTRRALRGVKRPAASSPPEAAARPLAITTPDTHLTAPLESRAVAADANAPVLLMSLPSSQPAAIALAPVLTASPWEAVRTSTTSAASGIARDAKATGARVWSSGVSIGRFVTRASKAGANVF